MAKKNTNADFYQIERFSEQQLYNMQQTIIECSKEIGGIPKRYYEVYKKRGWLIPFLIGYDGLLWGRWNYWSKINKIGTIRNSDPIPKIKWADLGSPGVQQTKKMLQKCLKHYDSNIDKFASWLLWGLGDLKELQISPELNKHYYENLDLFMVLNYPTDYLSDILSEQTSKGFKGASGYFPTPFNLAVMMTEMQLGNTPIEVLKKQKICDPCVGCGALLLPASNYFLRAYGTDINPSAISLCKIQMFWYAPWFARTNESLEGFKKPKIKKPVNNIKEYPTKIKKPKLPKIKVC